MQLPSRQRCYSQTTVRWIFTAHIILLQPTLEKRKRWYMGYYHPYFHAEEFKTYGDEHGRLHLEFHEHSDWPEQLSTLDFLIIRNSDHHSFVWIHHSPENSWGLIWPSML